MKPLIFILLIVVGVSLSLWLGGCSTFDPQDGYKRVESKQTVLMTVERTWDVKKDCANAPVAPGWTPAACTMIGPVPAVIVGVDHICDQICHEFEYHVLKWKHHD